VSSSFDKAHEQLAQRFGPLLRIRYVVLVVVAIASAVHVVLPPGHDDWSFFVWGSQLLFGEHPFWARDPGGLHVFANYRVQIGPMTLVVVRVLRALFGDDGSRTAAIWLMTALAPLVIRIVEVTADRLHPVTAPGEVRIRQLSILVGGAAATVAWIELGVHWVHIDDGLTLLAACVAFWAVATSRPWVVGVMIGAATAAKPWGIVIMPVVLALHGRDRRRAFAVAIACLFVTWAPFVIADLDTLRAGQLGVKTSAQSVLHLLGASTGAAPTWVRPAQLGIALFLGVLAAVRGQWPAVLLLGVSVRLLLDPAVFDYYSGGIVVAAFVWETLRARRSLPWLTLLLLWGLLLAGINLHGDVLPALLRLVACVLAVVAPFVVARQRGDVNDERGIATSRT
jgi:hypothetical protein